MPTQWRTIAPMLNRTATQCLEHYERLLDAAQRREEALLAPGGAAGAQRDPRDDPRRLRPGEIDPLPESKPARPDAVDMDEDEKEMLSEARARLANTKGKKAKRKAREKQLEEARRLAVVQKSREMAAAGIEVKTRGVKRREIDYNAEVPFERRPPPGFFSTRAEDEKAREEKAAATFRPTSLEQLEGKSKERVEEELRVRDAKRIRLLKEVDLPAVFDDVNRINDTDMVAKRMALTLPAPVLQEEELEAIAKLSDKQREEERLQAIAASTSHPSTRALLTPSFPTPQLPSRRTPLITAQRTPMAQDLVSREAENLLRLVNAQTPLLGGENKELHPSDFSRATPHHQQLSTPKPLTPLIGSSPVAAAGHTTPASLHANPAPGTPSRNGSSVLSSSSALAPPLSSTSMSASEALAAQSSRSAAREERQRKSHLKQLLSMLPAPKNEYALSDAARLTSGVDDDAAAAVDEDREDVEKREAREEQRRRDAEWRKESQVIQKHLPRPHRLPTTPLAPVDAVDAHIMEEVRALVERDGERHPLPVKGKAVNGARRANGRHEADAIREEDLQSAKALVEQEAPPLSEETLSSLAAALPRTSADDFLPLPTLSSLYSSLSSTAASSSSKLTLQLGGYWAVHGQLRTEIAALEQDLAKKHREKECYDAMRRREEDGVERRLRAAMERLTAVKDRERAMQREFQDRLLQLQQTPADPVAASHSQTPPTISVV